MTRKELSDKEIQLLKDERIWGRLFALLIAMACVLACLYLKATEPECYLYYIVLTSIIGVMFSGIVWKLTNRNVNLDIKEREVTIVKVIVEDKIIKTPHLGRKEFLPNQLQSTRNIIMLEPQESVYIVAKGIKVAVEPTLFAQVEKGTQVALFYSKRSNILLRVKKIEF